MRYTQQSHPELWDPPPGYGDLLRARFNRDWVERYLKAKRVYYCPDHPDACRQDEMSDERYDVYEDSIKRRWPNHPVLELVGWDDSYLNYVRGRV